MNNEERDFQRHLLEMFQIEAQERLTGLSSGLVELEQTEMLGRRAEVLETLAREAHSLKGAARMVNLSEVVAMARALESALAVLKQGDAVGTPRLFDCLHGAVDGTRRYLVSIQAEAAPRETADLQDWIGRLEQATAGETSGQPPNIATPTDPIKPPAEIGENPVRPEGIPPETPSVEKPAASETVRLPAARLGALLLEAEQLLSTKLSAEYHVAELKVANRILAEWEKSLELEKAGSEARAPAQPTQDDKSGLPGILGAEIQRVRLLKTRMAAMERSAEQNCHYVGIAVNNLLEDMKRILMLPCSTLLGIFPKMVRDLARDQGKEIDLVIEGGNINIDKRVLDEIKDPLIHLVRNSIDHGIERPKDRERKAKPRRGRLSFGVMQKDGGKVEIALADDGAGMDTGNIRSTAIKSGILTADDAKKLSDQEIKALVFRSGFTTSPVITDISGRGLGLAIVQEKVGKLNGSLSLESSPDTGTTFRLVLPLTLATFRGVLIRCGDYQFIVPTANVEQVLRIDRDEIKTVEHCNTIQIRGKVVALAKLADVMELPARATGETSPKVKIIVIGAAGGQIAFEVDEILKEQEVLVKPLGKQLARIRNISAATILGAGQVVPIINVQDLLASAVKWGTVAMPRAAVETVEEVVKTLLVVEDSITTRTLLKNILEAAGYSVWTAVDGIDGLTQLRERKFDLVVSDVMMPRMNGFELTAKIRADKRLAQIPVVLVTAQESREDRERGIDAGASAYIVKRSFDQSNLLESIKRLI